MFLKKKLIVLLFLLSANSLQISAAMDSYSDTKVFAESFKKNDIGQMRRLLERSPKCISKEAKKDFLGASFEDRNIEVMRLLVDSGADINFRFGNNATLLMYASQEGIFEGVKNLLELGADPNLFENDGNTALLLVAGKKDEKNISSIIRILKKAGANIDAQNADGTSAIMLLARYGYLQSAADLIELGADIKLRDKAGNSAITCAAHSGRIDLADLLIRRNADIDSKNDDGFAPIAIAALKRDSFMTSFLLENHAVVDSKDSREDTPLAIAASMGKAPVVESLINSRATVDSFNELGFTPLMMAALEIGRNYEGTEVVDCIEDYDYFQVVKLLVEAGADTDTKRGGVGPKAYDYAFKAPNPNQEVISFLKEIFDSKLPQRRSSSRLKQVSASNELQRRSSPRFKRNLKDDYKKI